MKIILATPLYPPETSDTAIYVKELAKQISDKHEIIIVAYASVSEKITNAKLITISKRTSLPLRLIKYFIELLKSSRNADVIYAQNSVAVCLPAILVGFLRNVPIATRYEADEAQTRVMHNYNGDSISINIIALMQKFILRMAKVVIVSNNNLQNKLMNEYKIKKNKITIISNPAKKEIILPFSTAKIPGQIISYDKNKTRAEMWYLYQTSQVCVLDQVKENTEDILTDCFSAGIPIVMKNETNFEKKIEQILQDEKLRENIIQDNKKILAKKFSWEAHIGALMNLFKNLSHFPRD